MLTNYIDCGNVNYIKTGVPLSLCVIIGDRCYAIGECIIRGFEIILGKVDIDLEITSIDDEYIGFGFWGFVGPAYVHDGKAYLNSYYRFNAFYNAVCLIQ